MPLSPRDASLRTREICELAPIVPVLVIDDLASARPLAEALVAGGLPALEVTLRTPVALEAIRAMADVPGGHVGVFVSRKAQGVVAGGLIDWMERKFS